MPIPALNQEGFLPTGVFDCTLTELVTAMQRSGLFAELLIDGSFAAAKPAPNDVG